MRRFVVILAAFLVALTVVAWVSGAPRVEIAFGWVLFVLVTANLAWKRKL